MNKIEFKNYDKTVQDYMADIVRALEESGKLVDADRISLDILANSLQRWRSAEEVVKKLGILLPSDRGNMSKNPAIDVGNAALRQAMAIMQEYGLTALSRKKLKRGETTEGDDSPLVGFFKNEQ